MGLKFVVLTISFSASLILAEAHASSMTLGGSSDYRVGEVNIPGAVSQQASTLQRAASMVTSDAVSFVSAARPGRWVSEFFPEKSGSAARQAVMPMQSFPIAGAESETVDSARAVRDLHAVVAEHANPFFSFRASEYVATASSQPLVLTDVGFGGAGGAMVMEAARTLFTEAQEVSSSAAGNGPPNAYVMLLAGLGLIGLMVRQRLSEA